MNTHVRDNLTAAKGLYYSSAANVSVTNTTTETTLASFSVAAGTLGTNNLIEVTLLGTYLQNVSTSGTLRLKYGATTVLTLAGILGANSAAAPGYRMTAYLFAENATNAQVGVFEVIVGPTNQAIWVTDVGNAAEDSTVAKTLEVTFQWAAASASASLVQARAVASLENI